MSTLPGGSTAAATSKTWIQRLAAVFAGQFWREHFDKELQKQRRFMATDAEQAMWAGGAVKNMHLHMAVQMAAQALTVADILVFAVVIRSFGSFAVLLAAAVALSVLLIVRGHFFPFPKNVIETTVSALLAILFFAATLVAAVVMWNSAIPRGLILQWSVTGFLGLAITSYGNYYYRWNPERYTEADCAYWWAKRLNVVWCFCWYLLQGATPAFSISWLCPALTAFPILFFTGMYTARGIKGSGLVAPREDGWQASSLSPYVRQKFELERKRDALFSFKSSAGEVMIACCLAVFFWAVFNRMQHYDPQQAWADVTGAIMMLTLIRYIRPANRRADLLLERELKALEEKIKAEKAAAKAAAAAD